MATWHLGTMGFGYKEWAGVFYPKGTKSTQYLSHYAEHFDAVELDTTFYATPTAERVRKWATAVPEDFRFAAKAPREVTHEGDVGNKAGAINRFVDVMRQMGPKLGAIVLQFPPSFGAVEFGELETLLAALPDDVRFAVELRNRSWGTSDVLDLLRARRVALVAAEYATRPSQIHVTTDFLYVRWVGEHNRFAQRDREHVDPTPGLAWWKARIGEVAGSVRDVWGFFNNDYSGYAVATCQRFRAMMAS